MSNQKLFVQDNSGDKKYFTIIPNYILNHSTLYDREVYIQMKRIAGEDGTCFTSKSKIAKQCGMSKRRLDQSIKYLLDHGWIELLGMRKIKTNGGYQDMNEYRIVDLWDLNNSFYQEKFAKGGASGALPSVKGGAQNAQRGCTDEAKGGAPPAPKEEPIYKEEPIKEDIYPFSEFWKIYPKKVGKGNTEKIWSKLSSEDRKLALEDIPRRQNDDKWLNGYIKDPERYLKYRQWEDEIIPTKSKIQVFRNQRENTIIEKLKAKTITDEI